MSTELKELIENTISYYGHHSMQAFVDGEEHLKHFVTDDFTHLLEALGKELV